MLGATSATRQLGPILERHPAKVGAIWSARLAVMATTAPTASNNCEFCLEVLRSTSRA